MEMNGSINQDNWLSNNKSICDWYPGTPEQCIGGIGNGDGDGSSENTNSPDQDGEDETNNFQRLLVSLELVNNNLQGTLPKTLSLLSSLKVLNLSDNKINGTLPQELLMGSSGQQKLGETLKVLDLSFNLIVGTIPEEQWGESESKKIIPSI